MEQIQAIYFLDILPVQEKNQSRRNHLVDFLTN